MRLESSSHLKKVYWVDVIGRLDNEIPNQTRFILIVLTIFVLNCLRSLHNSRIGLKVLVIWKLSLCHQVYDI